LTATCVDEAAGLEVELHFESHPSGLVRVAAEIINIGADPYRLDALRLALPVPDQAEELLDFTGRWSNERIPQTSSFNIGLHARENYTGRTGLDAGYLLVAGQPGFGFGHGQVWAVHLGFSGNQELYAERTSSGGRVLAGGERLNPSEVVLACGERYSSPWLYATQGIGLDSLAHQFHGYLRDRQNHPRTPRPVIINTWEAVYFKHDLNKLKALATQAAELGIERFVVDDGWFGSRRDDTSGLGDWSVSDQVWPNGLTPLIDHVHCLGMDFGIWVEPEMANLDSELARAHPEWIMQVDGRIGFPSRHQYVLDLTHPEAYRHILGCLDRLLNENQIAYLKWDHNRLLTEAGHSPGGEPVAHNQTRAVYRMMDTLRQLHPGLEIESCASGGGRIDLGMLEHTDRVWGSDCNDPLERVNINRYTQLLLPPELVGAHIGPSPSHTTGRQHSLDFRAGVTIWCHLGVEEDLTELAEPEKAGLGKWIAFHKANRDLLHHGRVINVDHPDPAIVIHGVIAQDQARALFNVVSLRRSTTWPPGQLRLPGLDPNRRYNVQLTGPAIWREGRDGTPPWIVTPGLALTGKTLATSGLRLPPLPPETLCLIELSVQRP
jgi:alpha-galactosidase